MSKKKYVEVYTTTGQTRAFIIKGFLESAGIPAIVSQESAGVVYGFTVGPMGHADVLVPSGRAAEARKRLASMERGEFALPDPSGENEEDQVADDRDPL